MAHHVDVENGDAESVIVLVHHSDSFIVHENRASVFGDSSPEDDVLVIALNRAVSIISYHPPPEPPWNSIIANGVVGLLLRCVCCQSCGNRYVGHT